MKIQTSLPKPLLLQLLDSVTQGVLVAGPDKRLLFCNAAFTAMTGFEIEDVFGQTCGFLQGEATARETIGAIATKLHARQPFNGEILNYKKSGEPFWNDLTIDPVPGSGGNPAYFIGIQRDISARKQAESELRAIADHHRHLFDNLLAGVVVHAPDTRILYANATATRLLGVHAQSILGATNSKWRVRRSDGSIMPAAEHPVNRALATGANVKNLVIGLRRPSERAETWLICDAMPIHNSDGTIREVVVNFTDITDLKKAQEALKKSEERLRLALQGSTDALFDWDLVKGEIYYSPRWWSMLGYADAELPSTEQLWRSLVHPQDLDRLQSRLDKFLQSRRETYELEFRLRHVQGHYVPVLSRGLILRGADGRAQRLSGTNSDITERKAAEEKIHQLAFYDPLTGLPNRRLLMIQLGQALRNSARNGRLGALLFIDLDHFKWLNDTLGHGQGDQLLQQVAARLRGTLRESDMVARLGGDEFLVILEDLSESRQNAALQADLAAQKLLDSCNLPYMLDGVGYHSTPSIGIALFDAATESPDELLKHADLAMYNAKAAGRNKLRFFDAGMQTAVERRVKMDKDLRDGLDREEMILHYQPQVDVTGRVVGAEALIRWQHPTQGLVPPGEFIPLAEQSGLILKLGNWVLRTACETLAVWAGNPAFAALTLSINVSARQLHETGFAAQVLAIIAQTGANPARLKLELTESILVENTETTIASMAALRAHGIAFVLDDFGTGYCSLSYLRRMPLDQLKIDRCFVAGAATSAHDATIARIIIVLGEKLGLTVVGEGIETEAQKSFLIKNGCAIFQGYLFGRPVPRITFESNTLAAT